MKAYILYLSLSNLFSVLFLHIQAGQYTLLNLVEGYPLLLVDQNVHKNTDQYHCHDRQNTCQRLWQMHVSGSGEKAGSQLSTLGVDTHKSKWCKPVKTCIK